mmetsp:Transcript_112/g.233  ORF Transcript_112/g.233 Transcript_112/m.233 type:complete len:130 (-) Transcript_112:2400-2789(-)
MALAVKNVRTVRSGPARVARRGPVKVQAVLEPSVAIGGATVASLFLGRFVFLPYQRREANFDSSVGPKTTGNSYYDKLQTQSSFTLTSKDPAGFGIIDVMGWGALGHVVGYAALAAASLQAAGIQGYPH